MSLAALCIRKPIAVFLLSIGLFITGAAAYWDLPVASLPRVDFPAIGVFAQLPGADSITMSETVAAPLERRLGAIGGISELSSTSADGSTRIIAIFDMDRDITGAAHDVQAAINAARSDLAVDLPNPPNYRKFNPSDLPILILSVSSKHIPLSQLYDLSSSVLQPVISRIPGVARVNLNGAAKPAVRVSVNPSALANTGLSMEDVRQTVTASSSNQPLGTLDGVDTRQSVGMNNQLTMPEDYARLILNSDNGPVLRLSDIAEVRNANENVRQAGWQGDQRAVILTIQKQPNANVIETVDEIKRRLPDLQTSLPGDITLSIVTDRTLSIRANVHDVQYTLIISTLLVIVVVFLTLGELAPTLATIITVPLSLAGTFGAMWLMGYSLNNISLMALTLSVGFVVDDAIVMIENIARHLERGKTPVQAAIDGAKEITFTVVSISLSLVAVFIPLLFMGGLFEKILREFSVTLTVAIMISMVVSLTVTPTLYALLIQAFKKRPANSSNWGDRVFAGLEHHYGRALGWALNHRRLMLASMVLTIFMTIALYVVVPKGLYPQTDTGLLIGSTQGKSDISFNALSEKHLAAVRTVMADPAVNRVASFIGSSGGPGPGTTNSGQIFIGLKPFSERDANAFEVIERLRPKLAAITGLSTYLQAAQDLFIGGKSTRAQFQYVLWSESLSDLTTWAPRLVEKLRHSPDFADVSSDMEDTTGQIAITIDRDQASRLGVSMAEIDQTLQTSFAQRQILRIFKPNNDYHVVMEVGDSYQQDMRALDHVYLKSSNDTRVRLSTVAHFGMETAPISVKHQGQFPAATISFNVPPGSPPGEAAEKVDDITRAMGLPSNIHFGPGGNLAMFKKSIQEIPLLILAAFLSIYIVLGVLYENTIHPLTIISTLPSAGLGALLALWMTGNELSIMSIIGVILLMGIVKKNGIMMVDFAIIAERNGTPPRKAIIEACLQRFRPIMMTTIAAILGALPLALSLGNGGEMRQPLGVAIVGGLIVSQMLTLFTTPAVYLAMDKFNKHSRKKLMEIPA